VSFLVALADVDDGVERDCFCGVFVIFGFLEGEEEVFSEDGPATG
jgi:hypothetical protein